MNHQNIKLLIIQPRIPHYRIELFKQLGSHFNLTILHSGSFVENCENYFKQIVWPVKKIGPFILYFKNLQKLCNNYNVIIANANLRYVYNFFILLHKRKYKWIAWGPGVSSSYKKKYDKDKSLDWLRFYIFKNADALLFYYEYPVNKYIKAGFPPEKLFVAHNTVFVEFTEGTEYRKNKLLFVGTLYKEKEIFELLICYKDAKNLIGENIIPLVIVGEGPELNRVKTWLKNNMMEKSVFITGAVFDHTVLEKYFRESYACISPGQAGLTVLTSMGYGTPFITRKDAITGGEIFNIENGVNGLLYDRKEELKEIIIDIVNNPIKYVEMGRNARRYYLQYRQLTKMVEGFIYSVKYVFHKTSVQNKN